MVITFGNLWYPYFKDNEGNPCFPSVGFGGKLKIIKETDKLVLFHKSGSTVYIPHRMVYSNPCYYLIRKMEIKNDGYRDYQQTTLVKEMEFDRKTKQHVLNTILTLMNEVYK